MLDTSVFKEPRPLYVCLPWAKRKPALVSARRLCGGFPYALGLSQLLTGRRPVLHGFACQRDAVRLAVTDGDDVLADFIAHLDGILGEGMSDLRNRHGHVFRSPRIKPLSAEGLIDCLVRYDMMPRE